MPTAICLLLFLIVYLSSIVLTTDIKRIVVVLFPGGKKINTQLKKLIDYYYSKANQTGAYPKSQIEFHIVLYQTDYELWKDYEPYIYSFGNTSYLYNGTYDIDEEPQYDNKQSFFSYYQPKLRLFYQEFLESTVLESLRNKRQFDMIITDTPNYIASLIAIQLDIPLRVIASMRPQPQLFECIFELNTNYYPMINMELSDDMTYRERCDNFFKYWSSKLIQYMSRYEIRYLFKLYGYSMNDKDYYLNDTLIMIQYLKSIAFPLSVPPNFILLNAILPIDSSKGDSSSIDSNRFKYNKVIVITHEANILIAQYLSLLRDLNKDIEFYNIGKSDVLFDLMNNTNVIALLSTGDLNAISQSFYHFKPVIIIGKGIRDANVKAFIKKKSCGIIVNDIISHYELNKAIQKITEDDNLYKRNAMRYGTILRGDKNAKEEFVYWINYGFRYNYTTLNVPFYKNSSWYTKTGFDVFALILILVLVAIVILTKVISYVYRRIQSKLQTKVKQD